jgi:hypothetical protein
MLRNICCRLSLHRTGDSLRIWCVTERGDGALHDNAFNGYPLKALSWSVAKDHTCGGDLLWQCNAGTKLV